MHAILRLFQIVFISLIGWTIAIGLSGTDAHAGAQMSPKAEPAQSANDAAAEPAARKSTTKRQTIKRVPTGGVKTIRRVSKIYDTKLQLVEGGGEFQFLKDEIVVYEQSYITLQWSTQKTNAATGRWEIRNLATGGNVVASGVDSPAPGMGKVRRITLPPQTFLLENPPANDTKFEITIRPYTTSNTPAGGASNPVYVTQFAGKNIPAAIQFGDGASFPSVEVISVDEQVGQVPLTQIYSTYADLKLRVRNNAQKKTDPMFLKIRDAALLYRQTAGPVSLPELNPGASMIVNVRVEAILPPARSQTPQARQVRSWRQSRRDKCGPEFRSLLDWRGPQSQTPITANKDSLLAMQGWGDYTKIPPSVPVCGATQCVRICDIEKSIRSRLDGRTVGYSYVIGGKSPKFGAGGKARTSADGTEIDFTSKTPITVASVSKWITAIAAMSIVRDNNNVDIDDPIGPFLPDEWNVGTYFQNVTMAQFLGQSSGIKDYGNVPQTYAKLRSFFEQPVNNTWMSGLVCDSALIDPPNAVNPSAAMTRCYSNYNFAIFRLLLPRVAGLPVDTNLATRPQTLANQYELLVRQNVFEPVGQTGTGCRPRGALPHAFAYKFPGDEAGQDWGDVRFRCGAAAWYVSAEDMAKVLFSINAKDGRILFESATESDIDDMRLRGLGLDVFNATELEKNGAWGAGGGLITATAAIFGPVSGPNVVGTLFINSEISGGPNAGDNAQQVLEDAYNSSLKPK
jgi:CubicO group peptidase (beta-lactamase class C family)